MKPMTQEEFLATGAANCPYCRSENIEAEMAPVAGDGEAWQEVYCCDCRKRWHEVYELKYWEPTGRKE